MKSRFIKLVVAFAVAFAPSLVFLFPGSSAAIDGSLRQQILPLNCIFQTVNDGTGLLFYVTPEECGVVVPPEPVDPTPGIIPTIPVVRQNEQLPAPLRILSPIPIIVSPQNTPTQSRIATSYSYPWQPLANVGSTTLQQAKQSDSPPATPPVAGVLAVAAILLIIIIIIL